MLNYDEKMLSLSLYDELLLELLKSKIFMRNYKQTSGKTLVSKQTKHQLLRNLQVQLMITIDGPKSDPRPILHIRCLGLKLSHEVAQKNFLSVDPWTDLQPVSRTTVRSLCTSIKTPFAHSLIRTTINQYSRGWKYGPYVEISRELGGKYSWLNFK